MKNSTLQLVLYFEKKHLESLGKVRNMPQLQIAHADEFFYAKGFTIAKNTEPIIATLPAKAIYYLDDNGLLFPKGKTTPTGRLPLLKWQSIRTALPVEMPVAALSGELRTAHSPKLTRTEQMQQSIALKTTFSLWQQYVETAAAIRLAQLKFAVSEAGDVLIWGRPLPPISGQEYWVSNGNFLPCGVDFEIPLTGILIQQKWNAKQEDILLFNEKGEWEKVGLNNFVKATRSAMRMTEI